MSVIPKKLLITFILLALFIPTSCTAQIENTVPDHFYNPKENLNPDPDHTPGNFDLADISVSKSAFYIQKGDLIQSTKASGGKLLFTLGSGELTFDSIKNETATVMGYFRNYFGVATMNDAGLEKLDMLVDINSLDTAVPGRNHRILNLFFRSMKPELGTATISFTEFEYGNKTLSDLEDGQVHTISASGSLTLNNTPQNIYATLNIQRINESWHVTTLAPISLLITDYNFGNRPYELMVSCNHKALGNKVGVNVDMYFR